MFSLAQLDSSNEAVRLVNRRRVAVYVRTPTSIEGIGENEQSSMFSVPGYLFWLGHNDLQLGGQLCTEKPSSKMLVTSSRGLILLFENVYVCLHPDPRPLHISSRKHPKQCIVNLEEIKFCRGQGWIKRVYPRTAFTLN